MKTENTNQTMEPRVTIEERIGSLEVELRRTKTLNSCCVVLWLLTVGGAVAVFVGQQLSRNAGAVTTNELRIVDAQGNLRARLAVHFFGPQLEMFNADGKPLMTLNGADDLAGLKIAAENGMPLIALYTTREGPRLEMYDQNENIRAVLDVDNDGSGLSMLDKNEELRSYLRVSEDGPVLMMGDKNGKIRTSLSVREDGTPGLQMQDENGKLRATMDVEKDGPAVQVLDKNGNSRALVGAIRTQSPIGKTIFHPESTFILFGPDGKILWKSPTE